MYEHLCLRQFLHALTNAGRLKQLGKVVWLAVVIATITTTADHAYGGVIIPAGPPGQLSTPVGGDGTPLFTENRNGFDWTIRWTGVAGPAAPGEVETPPAGLRFDADPAQLGVQEPWSASATLIGNLIVFQGQHLIGPDVGVDIDPGAFTALGFPGINLLPIGAGVLLGESIVIHPTAPGNPPHGDVYRVTYTRAVAGGPIDFRFTGTHVVPEPSTICLFGLGTLGLLGYGWRRRKRAAA